MIITLFVPAALVAVALTAIAGLRHRSDTISRRQLRKVERDFSTERR